MPEQHVEAVVTLLAMFRRGYAPGWTPWTDLEAGQAAAMTAEWVDALSPFGLDVLARAFQRHVESADGDRHPSLIGVLRLAQEVARESASVAYGSATLATCDGSGWVEDAGPCPSCAPALYDLWLDEGRWTAYRQGMPIWLLHPGVESTRGGGSRLADRAAPPPCVTLAADEDRAAARAAARAVTFAHGRIAGWVATNPLPRPPGPHDRLGRARFAAIARAHLADREEVAEAAVHEARAFLVLLDVLAPLEAGSA